GIARRERHVVAALDHAGAAALAEQALHRDGDRQRRIRLVRMQCREQPGAAYAEDQEVRVAALGTACHGAAAHRAVVTPSEASTAARRESTSSRTVSYRLPPWLYMATSSGPKSRMRNFQSDSGLRSSRSTSSMRSIQVVSSAAVPPMMAR